jgi:uncharacterized protein (UPF0335 family)
MAENGGNGYDRQQLEGFLSEIDDGDARLLSLRGEYMQACKGVREDINAVYDRVKDAGVPVRAFKTIVKNRRLNRQIDANVQKLEEDAQASYDKLCEDLGDYIDLPLGKAAADRARPKATETSLDSLAAG